MRPPPIFSVGDAFLELDHKEALKKLQEICFLYRESLPKLLCQNLFELGKYYLNVPQKLTPEDFFVNWMEPSLLNLAKTIHSPPLHDYLTLKPGKGQHIHSIYNGLEFAQFSFIRSFEPIFYPFLSQPIVEWALSIPSYKLYGKGYDRIPVRKAISETFQTDTVWRVDKGSTTGQVLTSVRENLKFINDICLDGLLAKEKLVNKSHLEKHIQMLSAGDARGIWPFIYLYCTEVFLRFWDNPKSC